MFFLQAIQRDNFDSLAQTRLVSIESFLHEKEISTISLLKVVEVTNKTFGLVHFDKSIPTKKSFIYSSQSVSHKEMRGSFITNWGVMGWGDMSFHPQTKLPLLGMLYRPPTKKTSRSAWKLLEHCLEVLEPKLV